MQYFVFMMLLWIIACQYADEPIKPIIPYTFTIEERTDGHIKVIYQSDIVGFTVYSGTYDQVNDPDSCPMFFKMPNVSGHRCMSFARNMYPQYVRVVSSDGLIDETKHL